LKYTRLYGDRARTRPDLETLLSSVFHLAGRQGETVRVTNNLSAYSTGTLKRILAGP